MNFSKKIDMQYKKASEKKDIHGFIEARKLRIQSSIFESNRLKIVLHLLKKDSLGAVLELGCNIGLAAGSYEHKAKRIVLCDNDYFTLQAAKIVNNEIRKKLDFVGCDITDLPFKDKLFDTVICFEVLEHLEHDRHAAVLKEILRISRPGASIYISTPNRYSLPGLEGKVLELFVPHYRWDGWDSDHKYIYTSKGFINFIKKFSIDIDRVYGYYFLPGSLLIRMPVSMQKALGFFSYIISKYLGTVFPFRYLGFTTIIKFRKE